MQINGQNLIESKSVGLRINVLRGTLSKKDLDRMPYDNGIYIYVACLREVCINTIRLGKTIPKDIAREEMKMICMKLILIRNR